MQNAGFRAVDGSFNFPLSVIEPGLHAQLRPGMDLSKLTVPQLKALCKEKKLTGYSKLNKPALIAKLEGGGASAATNTLPRVSTPSVLRAEDGLEDAGQPGSSVVLAQVIDIRSEATQLAGAGNSGGALRHAEPENTSTQQLEGRPNLGKEVLTRGPVAISESPICDDLALDVQPTPLATSIERRQVSEYIANSRPPLTASRKRKGAPSSENPAAKRPKESTFNNAQTPSSKFPKPNNMVPKERPAQTCVSAGQAIPSSILKEKQPSSSAPAIAPSQPIVFRSKKAKFTPLIPKLPPAQLPPVSHRSEAARPLAQPPTGATECPVSGSSGKIPLDQFFHFPPLSDVFPTPQPISLPPSISQRRKVPKLSTVFSLLFHEDLCVLGKLGRLYRYSAYIAASHILRRDFPDRRLDETFKKHSPNMNNFWPYLRHRRKEVADRKRLFDRTFLGEALKQYPYVISPQLWRTNDNQAFSIAVRFLLTCLYYRVSIGLDQIFRSMTVLSAEEVVRKEVWRLTLRIGQSTCYYYVLEATCEVVGLPGIPAERHLEAQNPDRRKPFERVDWTQYIESKIQDTATDPCPKKTLMDYLSWPNHEEYDRGISRNWLRRVEREGGAEGEAKLAIAQKYVLACLVANRVMTSREMEQEFNGTSVDLVGSTKMKKKHNLNLYLPSHHLVESVHLVTGRNNTPFHPAIAGVQTPGREYFVLRDNGMQIGCEEDGIPPVWMSILGCDERGVAVP
ncbi:hypothetical protein EST38_g1348 [Candolleomyces aberdarensis]|uniref:Rho termination factor-like N-terminal domain-containing protein n=1 Tax=Candolleomyces aberdarensis TaxID=2316362 RepID=A0A4Q2DYR6_9AGAR|nr:hypothetical protein EST38_g1348 [Candolleomyces aberdarensis]